jgi:hypothetical protein
VLVDQFHQLDLARPDSATRVEVNAQCQPWHGRAPGLASAASGESFVLLLAVFHFGAVAEGWNSCSPPTLYAPIVACPSGDNIDVVFRFVCDSLLEGGVTCELVSGNPDFNVRKKENGRPKAKFDQYLDLV